MARYIARRVLSALVTLVSITVIIFFLLSLLHGSSMEILRDWSEGLAPAEYEALRHSLGLDQPVWVQYLLWVRDVLRGNLGMSYRYAAPVGSILVRRFGPSLLLCGTGTLIAALLALPLGVMAAYRPRSPWGMVSSVFAVGSACVPRFLVCIAFIYLFSFRLHWFPAMGMHAAGNTSLSDLIRHLILPASVIALSVLGPLIKQTRSACLEVFQEEYIKAARARGLSELEVVWKHGVRTALASIVTAAALEIPGVISGAAILEKIFAWPGIGSLMIESILSRDTPVIMGIALLIAVTVLVVNIVLDILYGLLDPRVRVLP